MATVVALEDDDQSSVDEDESTPLNRAESGSTLTSQSGELDESSLHSNSSGSLASRIKKDTLKFYESDSFLCSIYSVMGYILGAQFVAIQATSGMLAVRVDYSIEESITIFLAESLGSLLGLAMAIWLYQNFYCQTIMLSSLIISAMCFVVLIYITNFVLLHVIYFILGCTFVLTGTSVQFLVCKIMGSDSGIWIAALQTCFLAGGTLPMALRSYIEVYDGMYTSIAIATILIAMMCICAPNAQSVLPYLDMHHIQSPHFWTEIFIGLMAAMLLGSFISMSYYSSFVFEATTSMSSDTIEYELTTMWVFATLGSSIGLIDELFLDQALGLAQRLTVWQVLLLVFSALLALFTPNEGFSWVELCCFGFLFGPSISFALDWVYRATYLSETSMAIVMGIMFGGSLLHLYLVGLVWVSGNITTYFFWIIFLTLLAAYLLLPIALKYSYISSLNFLSFDYRPLSDRSL